MWNHHLYHGKIERKDSKIPALKKTPQKLSDVHLLLIKEDMIEPRHIASTI